MTKYLALEIIVEIADDADTIDVLEDMHRMFCKDPEAEYCPMQSAASTVVDSVVEAYDWLRPRVSAAPGVRGGCGI
jgi:hypothetical protein